MPAIATGVGLADRELVLLGVSGDGDSASIGLGQFMHLMRRNLDCTYIIEDNGTYGLTKGQFSATADIDSLHRKGTVNHYPPIDPCAVALTVGTTFVARSFSGDGRQLVPLIKAAVAHRGTALIDIISPCVTFNDHDGSTRSYSWIKDNDAGLHDLSFIPYYEEIKVDYEPDEVQEVDLYDGSTLVLSKLSEDHDPTDRLGAIRLLEESRARGQLLTGLLYVDEHAQDFATRERLTERPLRDLGETELRIGRDDFDRLMGELM
jgi:2-oxoglutarate ferredoxin oxidoreductase subunit beta